MAEGSPDLRQRAERVRAAVTPHPHRGDLIAAGAGLLTIGVLLVNVRMDTRWGTGIFLVLDLAACALVLGMGVLAALEGERPRPYQQVLLLAGLLLLLATLFRLDQVLGTNRPLSHAGARVWVFGIVAAAALWLTLARRSAICALVAALAGIVVVLSFVDWVFHPHGPTTFRWILLLLAIGFVLAALWQRDRRRRESVYLVDAAGVAVVVLALTFVGALVGALTLIGAPAGMPGAGWKLVLLAAGLGLVAYAAVDGEPGPAYIGVLTLLLFVGLVGIPGAGGPSLWFWPLVLLALGASAVAAGLRPRRPLPPEPSSGSTAPTEPLPHPGTRERPDAPTEPLGGPVSREPSDSLWAGPRPGDEP
jgi:peptidoglycan/LPS O-acetylase OafA/YrhL